MKIQPTNFTGFHGVFMAPLSHCQPIANNVKIKDFIQQQWEQKRTPLKACGL